MNGIVFEVEKNKGDLGTDCGIKETKNKFERMVELIKKPFTISNGPSSVTVSLSEDNWCAAHKLNPLFKSDTKFNETELLLSFLQFSIKSGELAVASELFNFLKSSRLKGNNPHFELQSQLVTLSLPDALKIYYEATEKISAGTIETARSAFLTDTKIRALGVFGGQACSEDLLAELKEIVETYGPLVEPLFHQLANLLKGLGEDPETAELFMKGFDIKGWLSQSSDKWPAKQYILSAPISLPLVGLVQLLNYYVLFKSLGVSPGELCGRFSGAGVTGHSQGIVVATIVALAKTEEDFIRGAEDALKLLFLIGVQAQLSTKQKELSASSIKDAVDGGEGVPSPMLAITGLPRAIIEAKIKELDELSGENISIGLRNGINSYVCCGPIESLYSLMLILRQIRSAPTDDQSRVPFNERKMRFNMIFLPISVPFHCALLTKAVQLIVSKASACTSSFSDNPQPQCPVFHTQTGDSIFKENAPEGQDLIKSLVEQICVLPVDWPLVLEKPASHLLDFGPGHESGIGAMSNRVREGAGIKVILAGSLKSKGQFGNKSDLFNPTELAFVPSWKTLYSPKLIKAEGKVWVETRFSILLAKPPVMVAGMTPCTVAESFVTACIKAGYHVELAGGGHFNEKVLRDKIDQIIEKVGNDGCCSITLNSLFLNPRLWAFQYPIVKKMRQEGYPIDGFTIAAGVPSFDSACEIVESLRQAGIRHVNFKPGSTQSILEVVKIAKANPKIPVVLQWTGGRGGGHHSFEDFHGPIIDTYAIIRSASNIILVAGSGFGDGEGSLPYLTGSWSRNFNLPEMPFDGILLGSRMMVAAENLASQPVKELIVAASGITDESQWVTSYKKPIGGVVTVRSELGEPIHKIATRGVLLWKELDETIFCLPPGEKRMAAIKKKRDYLIKRLNEDHQKVWFGWSYPNGNPIDLSEMTYWEVSKRLGDLTYVWHQERWIDVTYKKLLELFLRRTEERFMKKDKAQSILSDHEDWFKIEGDDVRELNPTQVIEPFFEKLPEVAKTRIISREDMKAFLGFCAIPWHKPVPFIPTFDDDKLEYWFKKDSLWQAEDVDAVMGQDAQRVAILHGPVAAYHSKKVNQPVKEILDNINQHYIQELSNEVPVKEETWFGGDCDPKKYPLNLTKACLTESIENDKSILTVICQPEGKITTCDWLELLSGPKKSWLRALLRSPNILKGPKSFVSNPVRTIFKPRPGFFANLYQEDNALTKLELFNANSQIQAEASFKPESSSIELIVHYEKERGSLIPLKLHYEFNPSDGVFLIRESATKNLDSIREFYWNVWFGTDRKAEFDHARSFNPLADTIESTCITVDEAKCGRFRRIVSSFVGDEEVPLDFAMVTCWEAVIKALFSDSIKGDILRLVHLSNEIISKNAMKSGLPVTTKARVMAIVQGPTGRTVRIQAVATQAGLEVARVNTEFFIRDLIDRVGVLFERIVEPDRIIDLRDLIEQEIFKAKPWVSLTRPTSPYVTIKEMEILEVTGTVNCTAVIHDQSGDCIGSVSMKDSKANLVKSYLEAKGAQLVEDRKVFEETGGYTIANSTITTPSSNQIYSNCSGDFNPIHTSQALAEFVGLPGTITHGLWTSAAVRGSLGLSSVYRYKVGFVDMVLPGEEITATARHIGMIEGRKLIQIQAKNSQGQTVLEGEAELFQKGLACVFTGQGSQEQGMGMDLYASSPIARSIWDQAEAHLKSTYGFSILQIVRENPKSLTVHFGGSKGASIRSNYMQLRYDTEIDGKSQSIRIFPEINESSSSYTFNSPSGLLSMTQFTQPALCLMEIAAFRSMKAEGVISSDCSFAGHSLGEYAALSSVEDAIPIEALVDIVFFRGLSMQVAVERDAEGRSPYGMAAVNPARVAPTFKEAALILVVRETAKLTGKLLEIVNYNVKDWQYVVAGELIAIEILTNVLNWIHASAASLKFDTFSPNQPEVIEGLHRVIQEATSKVYPVTTKTLKRGVATIPLNGIDVPFHSSFLLPGVVPFRSFLSKHIRPEYFEPEKLIGRYIPNLVARPFSLDLEYVKLVQKVSGSPILAKILQEWSSQDRKVLCATLLIELLSYQFASPVRWIETQEVLFGKLDVNRFIEIGPAPTLTGMAERTLKMAPNLLSAAKRAHLEILSHARDRDAIFFRQTDPEAAAEPPTTNPTEEIKRGEVEQLKPSVAIARPTQSIDDLPIGAAELIHIMVAQKVRRPGHEISLTKTIKEIAGGKSTLQNELMGDFQKEFGTVPERAEETPLAELGNAIERGSGWTKAPGKFVSGLVSKMLSSKLPSGFNASAAKAFLQAELGIGPKAADSIFAISLLNEPANRFGSEDAAKSWLRSVAIDYLKTHGIELISSSSASASQSSTSMISSEELERIQLKQNQLFKKQLALLAEYLGEKQTSDPSSLTQEMAAMQADLDLWIAEHGQTYADGIKPIFSPPKARTFDSWWNWARQEAAKLLCGKIPDWESLGNKIDSDVVNFLNWFRSNNQTIQIPVENLKAKTNDPPKYKPTGSLTSPKTIVDETGKIHYEEIKRSTANYSAYTKEMIEKGWVSLKSPLDTDPSSWSKDPSITTIYQSTLENCASGTSFSGKHVLMTGCGRGSIGCEMLKGLLQGGAKVVCTTSSYHRKTLEFFRELYEKEGAKGSCLVVVPWNQASMQDVNRLCAWIHEDLGWELDAVVPFAAIPENGRSLMDLEDGKSELAHRLMLTNLMRLLGAIAKSKEQRGIFTRPAQVILPLSPNHGAFGWDGLYGESKAALETLLNRWHSESWQDQLSIVGAIIGWTRGTGLMNDNNLVAEGIEALGVRTFSVGEMAFNLLALMTPKLVKLSEQRPILADLAGGMNLLKDLHVVTRKLRESIQTEAKRKAALHQEKQRETALLEGDKKQPVMLKRRAHYDLGFQLSQKPHDKVLEGINPALVDLLDLAQTIVVVGYGEVGPWGGARTRWEMESKGTFSLEGCIELAWMMGLIRYKDGRWTDAATGEAIEDLDIKSRYEGKILENTGIRFINPESFAGYDPRKRTFIQEIVIDATMGPIEVSSTEAAQFKVQHGDKVQLEPIDGDRVNVKFLPGCTFYIPKALQSERLVAGQLPTGWDATRYGIPKDIVEQVDPVTLYNLVSTVEALVSAGITDPYEFYQYVHVSEVGNTSGGGVGGQLANQRIYKHRFMESPVQSDILQESFINVMPAWVNLLLLSSAGPIKTPVGACATAVESVEVGVDTLLSGKAKIVLVGGYDDFREEGSAEFALMGATSSALKEAEKGREPVEMSRPMARSRAGFMESLGSGTQVLMSAELAIKMGCPIYGIIAGTSTATDKEGRSVPAPGQGILTTARRLRNDGCMPRVLSVEYRREQFEKAKKSINYWFEEAILTCKPEELTDLQIEASRRLAVEKRHWNLDFAQGDPRIAPLEASLARFGLTVDDIGVASFHGTGTQANDPNESEVLQRQLNHLGRTPGNMLPAICQKYLTGHPKGAAAAWMLNGALQCMNSGIIPPNRNADNIEPKLRAFTHIFHPTKPIHLSPQTGRIKAVLLKSFGFGQVGGEVLLVHPDCVLAALPQSEYEKYLAKVSRREQLAKQYTLDAMLGDNAGLVQVKSSPPYPADLESQVYLNPLARAQPTTTGSWAYTKESLEETSAIKTSDLTTALSLLQSDSQGVGVDVQLLADLPIQSQDFLHRNYTEAELEYCRVQPDERASLAGRWAAKEAVVKAMCSRAPEEKPDWLQGPGAPLKAIEVIPGLNGAPMVSINGQKSDIKLSISHSGAYAVAIALLPK